MRVRALTGQGLLSFLRSNLVGDTSFILLSHILTEPFISLFCGLPPSVKRSSAVYLDENKNMINDYAVRRLKACGFRDVFYAPNLHAKVLLSDRFVIVGSANFSSRAVNQNLELDILIEVDYRRVVGLVDILRRIQLLSRRV